MRLIASTDSRIWYDGGPNDPFRAALKGQSLAEYGLIISLIAVVCITALNVLGSSVSNQFLGLAATLGSVNTAASSGSTQAGSGEAAGLRCNGNSCDGPILANPNQGW